MAHKLALLGGLVLLAFGSSDLRAADFQSEKTTTVLGKGMGAQFSAGAPVGPSLVQTVATLEVLGKSLQAMRATVTAPVSIDGTSYMEFYSFGRRVFSETSYAKLDGLLSASAGLAPAEVRIPALVYPVGPLLLEIAGGVRFQAELQGQILPTISVPLPLSVLGIELQGTASGAAFIEGYAKFLALRGGVGGQLGLLDGSATVQAQFFFDGHDPVVYAWGMVEFLKGRLYAFADIFNVSKWGWSRFWDHDLFNWKGTCYASGLMSCPE